MISLSQWAQDLRSAAVRCRPLLESTLAIEMRHLAGEAAEMPGAFSGWPPLAESTIAEKAAAGYAVPSPLLRTGALQAGISGGSIGLYGAIGATEAYAVYHEFGTSRMPPRPIFSYVMKKNLHHLEEVFGELAVRLLMPGKR